MTLIRIKHPELFRPGPYLERRNCEDGVFEYKISKVWEDNGRMYMSGMSGTRRHDDPELVTSIDLEEFQFFRLHSR